MQKGNDSVKPKILLVILWLVQILLAFLFGWAGYLKLFQQIEQLAAIGMSFVHSYDELTVRIIGLAELLGAVGLILPSMFRIWPVLTPISSAGLGVVMILATKFHLSHGEPILSSVLFLGLCVFICWGRFFKFPIQGK